MRSPITSITTLKTDSPERPDVALGALDATNATLGRLGPELAEQAFADGDADEAGASPFAGLVADAVQVRADRADADV